MQSKYKIVLSLAQELGIELENIQKYVQWYKIQTGINYDFIRFLATPNCVSFELENDVKTLVDVRKNAYSNKFGFSKKEFVYCLERSGIKYIHIPELGIASEKRQELKTAKSSSSNGYDLFGISQVKVVESLSGVGIVNL